MSSLLLVRHAQGSLFTEEYDRLSDLGRTQARKLGEYWRDHGMTFDEVYVGPRARQQETAALAGEIMAHARMAWPTPTLMPSLDEYDIKGLFGKLLHELARNQNRFAELLDNVRQTTAEPDRSRHFQRLLEALTLHWLHEVRDAVDVETWPAFQQRVREFVEQITSSHQRGRRIAAFTSGGFIGTALQHVLQTPEGMALEMSWRIRNCSLTGFLFQPGRITLDFFNATPHLQDPNLVTFR